jgi:hypothetical protein
MGVGIRENADTLDLRLSRSLLASGVGDALCLCGSRYKENQD